MGDSWFQHWQNHMSKAFGLKEMSLEQLLYRTGPRVLSELARQYFRLELEGLEYIPKQGPAILTPNHSGFNGLDALLIADSVYRGVRRVPRVLTHRFWFLTPMTSIAANKFGFVEARKESARQQLSKQNVIILFPEGEFGNFKPSLKRYRLQEFRRGFVRLALEHQCPIVPVVVIGAEETSLNLATLTLKRLGKNTPLPLPLNWFPLPAKWKIRFLPPVDLPYKPSAAEDAELVHEICLDIRERMQKVINQELSQRSSSFFNFR